ncbi:hypothetical protein Tco_1466976 [Tanacetum coccineum]
MPNGKQLESILKGLYQMKVIIESGDASLDPPVAPITLLHTEKNLKDEDLVRFLADKEAINILLLGLPDEVYQTVDAAKRIRYGKRFNGRWKVQN